MMARTLVRKAFGSSGLLVNISPCISVSARNLNLLEYQSKELLRDCGVSIQNFAIVDDWQKTNSILEKLSEFC